MVVLRGNAPRSSAYQALVILLYYRTIGFLATIRTLIDRVKACDPNLLEDEEEWLLPFDSNEDLTEPESVALPIKLGRNMVSAMGCDPMFLA